MAQAYDLVCTSIYPDLDDGISMSIGDEFKFANIGAMHWTDFAQQVGMHRSIIMQEMLKLAKAVKKHVVVLAQSSDFIESEQTTISKIGNHIQSQADQMLQMHSGC